MKKIIIIVIIILLMGAFIIIQVNNIDINKTEGKATFVKKFSTWVVQLSKNTGDVVGYAFNKPWLPGQNATKVK